MIALIASSLISAHAAGDLTVSRPDFLSAANCDEYLANPRPVERWQCELANEWVQWLSLRHPDFVRVCRASPDRVQLDALTHLPLGFSFARPDRRGYAPRPRHERVPTWVQYEHGGRGANTGAIAVLDHELVGLRAPGRRTFDPLAARVLGNSWLIVARLAEANHQRIDLAMKIVDDPAPGFDKIVNLVFQHPSVGPLVANPSIRRLRDSLRDPAVRALVYWSVQHHLLGLANAYFGIWTRQEEAWLLSRAKRSLSRAQLVPAFTDDYVMFLINRRRLDEEFRVANRLGLPAPAPTPTPTPDSGPAADGAPLDDLPDWDALFAASLDDPADPRAAVHFNDDLHRAARVLDQLTAAVPKPLDDPAFVRDPDLAPDDRHRAWLARATESQRLVLDRLVTLDARLARLREWLDLVTDHLAAQAAGAPPLARELHASNVDFGRQITATLAQVENSLALRQEVESRRAAALARFAVHLGAARVRTLADTLAPEADQETE